MRKAKFRYECPDCGLTREFRTLPMYPPICCGWVMRRIPTDGPTDSAAEKV